MRFVESTGIDKDKIAMLYYNSVTKVIIRQQAGMAQSVERRIGSAEVTGPIPVASLKTP